MTLVCLTGFGPSFSVSLFSSAAMASNTYIFTKHIGIEVGPDECKQTIFDVGRGPWVRTPPG